MASCAQCGAALSPGAAWCGLCYLPATSAAATIAAYVAVSDQHSWPAPSPLAAAPPPPSVGWAPPQRPSPRAEAAADLAADDFTGRLLDRRAVVLVVIAICIGGIVQLVALALGHRNGIEPDTLIRYDLVLTVGFYAVVGLLIASQVTPSVRLRWGEGPLTSRVGVGLAVGVSFSLVVLGLASAAAHHLRSDPRIVLLMSEGDATHIVITVLLTCVAAPIIEETLFRGLLLESLRPRGTAVAILVSAGAFAVWHFIPAALVYYSLLGAALGGLYLKRGLACSMAAHFGFNAVLTVAAICLVTGPAHTVAYDGLTVTTPAGWSTVHSVDPGGDELLLSGPADAQLAIFAGPAAPGLSADSLARVLREAPLPAATVVPAGAEVTQQSINGGVLVEVPLTVSSYPATLAIAGGVDRSFRMVFVSAGSTKAASDFTAMMSSLAVS